MADTLTRYARLWAPFGWLRWKIGHHSAAACYWLHDRLQLIENLGHRLHRWGYK